MRPNQNNKNRMRNNRPNGNQNNNIRKSSNPLSRTYESNGPDIKIRGTPHHIVEKYLQLARDAQTSGDQVLAENYLQFSEHYFRIILGAQQGFQNQNAHGQGNIAQGNHDSLDSDDEGSTMPDRFASPFDQKPQDRTMSERGGNDVKDLDNNAERTAFDAGTSEQPVYRNGSDSRQDSRQDTYANRQNQNRYQNSYQDQPSPAHTSQINGTQDYATRQDIPRHVRTRNERPNQAHAANAQPNFQQDRSNQERPSQERPNQERYNNDRNNNERLNYRNRPRYENRFDSRTESGRNQDERTQNGEANFDRSQERQERPASERGFSPRESYRDSQNYHRKYQDGAQNSGQEFSQSSSAPTTAPLASHDGVNALPSFIVAPPRPYTPVPQPNSASEFIAASGQQDHPYDTNKPMPPSNGVGLTHVGEETVEDNASRYRKRSVRAPYRTRKREFEPTNEGSLEPLPHSSLKAHLEEDVGATSSALPSDAHYPAPHLPLSE